LGDMSAQNILLIGNGGREHALAWKLAQSPLTNKLYIAPGNAGTAQVGENVAISAEDILALLSFAQENDITLTLVGPELPLADGIVDRFQAHGLAVFGPTQAAARLESSKAFSKAFMQRHAIPTARYATFTDFEQAIAYLASLPSGGVVVKASGLAAGKGVIVCDAQAQARQALVEIMQEKQFGDAGAEVVIEERLVGDELSLLALTDGKTVVPLAPARDHKRVFDNDAGPNTGGMGVYAPLSDLDADFVARMTREILQKTVDGMAAEGHPFVGVLYAGLMLTPTGVQVLEFNCRFGDPETQVLMPLLASDLVELCLSCLDGTLSADSVKLHDGAAAAVVMASAGYPAAYPKGVPIVGVAAADALPQTVVFHAGTDVNAGQLVTSGGRVLAVSALGDTLADAIDRAYAGIDKIKFEGAHYRRDIGRLSEP
jgi:phosphoribosylamine--glycine ligase